MNKQKTSSLMILLAGIVIGIVISLSIGAILSWIDTGTALTGFPKTYGDIKIWCAEIDDVTVRDGHDVSNMMYMAKDNISFLAVDMDKEGEVRSLSLLDEQGDILFTVEASPEPGKWEKAIYAGSNGTDHTTGEMYMDINFDGHFDAKHIFDDTGEKVAGYIYIDKKWVKVGERGFWDDGTEKDGYIFNKDSGWKVLDKKE